MNPEIAWRDINQHKYLFLTFDGHFSADDSKMALAVLSSRMREQAQKLSMVWECTKMVGYDNGAREVWQAFIRDNKSRIETIHLISNSIVIRTGASVISIFAGIRISAWKDLGSFEAKA